MIVWMLVFEVMAATMLLKAIVRRSELNTREKLLEIEYPLAELTEKSRPQTQTIYLIRPAAARVREWVNLIPLRPAACLPRPLCDWPPNSYEAGTQGDMLP